MIAVLLADGFEEIEALTPLDILRRAGMDARTVGINAKVAVGAHGISVVCDLSPDEVPLGEVSMAIFPGGMPGSLGLDASPFTDKIIEAVSKNGGRLAAICAAPLVLGRRGLLEGKRVTCYPGFEKELAGATVTDEDVVTDGPITTSRGMGTALDFSLELVRLAVDEECSNELADSIMYRREREATQSELLKLFELAESVEEEEEECAVAEYTAERYPDIEYTYPDVSLLKEYAENELTSDELAKQAELVEGALAACGIKGSLSEPTVGPRLSCYELIPSRAISAKKVVELVEELSTSLAAEGIRITLPKTDEKAFRIEIPRARDNIVSVRSLLECKEFKNSTSRTVVALGKEVDGTPLLADIAKMPHLLVGGATGMGKSVCLGGILTSLVYKNSPSELKLILIDPKAVEFSLYRDIPHLLVPIATAPSRAVAMLRHAISIMNSRYELFSNLGIRNLDAYNKAVGEDPSLGKALPRIVIVIDELADLILAARKDTESALLQLTQKARAAGIHVIIGTQRPGCDVITGVIKANMPSRIAFRVATVTDSRNLLDASGAEKLLNRGDMLYSFVGSIPKRVQGAFISDSEVKALCSFLRSEGGAQYSEVAIKEIDALERATESKAKDTYEENEECGGYLNDKLFMEAVDLALNNGKISTSFIQRKLNMGYSKAARFIDIMEDLGIISPPDGAKPRQTLITRSEWTELLKNAGIK